MELRNGIRRVPALLPQDLEDLVILLAGVSRQEGLDLPEHVAPRPHFLVRVMDLGDGFAAARADEGFASGFGATY